MLVFPYTTLGVELWSTQHKIEIGETVYDQLINEFDPDISLHDIIQYFLYRPGELENVFDDPFTAKKIVEYILDSFKFKIKVTEDTQDSWKKVALIAYIICSDDTLLPAFFAAANETTDPSDDISEIIFLDNQLIIVFEVNDG